MESRYRMLQRAFTILSLLSVRPWRLEEIARVCRVHERTIRRDFAALEECGFEIERVDEAGLWRLGRRPNWWEMRP